MTLHDIVWTTKKPQQYFRHIAFWLAQAWFWGCWTDSLLEGFHKAFIYNVFKGDGILVIDAIYTYLVAYYYTPKYFEKNEYRKFCFSVFLLTLLTYVLFIAYQFWITDSFNRSQNEQFLLLWYSSTGFIFAGPPAVCAMFLTIKMFKNYYLKMREREMLVKENANAELQVLKAQVHPHFLFNTLNNIYSFALSKSVETSGLVLKLKNTIKYMVDECNVESVLLEKEIDMLNNYIGLEKVRYGQRLRFNMSVSGNYHNKTIAPLLLVPFVENTFKHSISKMRGNHQIDLSIGIIDNQLEFSIINDRLPDMKMSSPKKGIGLSNVQKRLQLLYPDKHMLVIQSTEKKFEVYLKIELGTIASTIKESPVKIVAYA
ncbi:hypothetical protein A4H97_15020 [Niastella yeongjuensis]|uniref:Signal transduction histidine kinase internal region domain-containing protein n=1 Tax=Niastella yeongjuensis TaxID=354355 RepID=A0A1V9E4S6_9BACT|nr:histidine kinase [Niastella yeongjuensis]OQP40915.1 hypothetical protein A4H97_15020 [Niastella yeongjuensis]SEO97994.1 Histidine kinase [Niastella yeongjuensis]